MQKQLLRVTQVEKFRRFISGDYEYETEQGVMDAITGEFRGNPYTWIGTAFHRIVEGDTANVGHVPPGERHFLYYGRDTVEEIPAGRSFDVDGNTVVFDVPQCRVALGYKKEHPRAFHEIRRYMDYGEVVLTGCADMIDGLEIRDIKTKYSAPSDGDYYDSCQWRYYMELFGADTFHFDLFVFEGYNMEKHGTDVRGLPLRRHDPSITCYSYPGMVQDNRYLMTKFIEWLRFRNLFEQLPTWQIR